MEAFEGDFQGSHSGDIKVGYYALDLATNTIQDLDETMDSFSILG